MHELDITKQLTKEIKKNLRENNIKEGRAVVELGSLSTFSKQPMEYYYNLIAKEDKVLSNIKLDIYTKNGKIKCLDCGEEKNILDFFDKLCDNCSSINTEIVEGRSVYLKRIEKN